MEHNKVHDRRPVKLDHVMARDYIPFKEGRPRRDTPISPEDIVNLVIALNTATTLDEFLRLV